MRLIAALVLSLLLQPAFALTFYTEDNPPLNLQRDGRVQGVTTAVVTRDGEARRRAGGYTAPVVARSVFAHTGRNRELRVFHRPPSRAQ